MLARAPRFASGSPPPSRPRPQADTQTIATRLAVVSLALSLVTLLLWLLFWSSSGPDLVWLALLPAGVLVNGVGLMMALVALQKARLAPQVEVRTLARVATGVALLPLAGSALFVALSLAFGG
ncbi:MAG: hypothetical protein MUC45_01625 [Actinomycetia bacterium]|jgi:hypothetical protein|nr:hypothetical protein [Actinomycetes bacterium]